MAITKDTILPGLVLVTAATEQVVSLDEVKDQLRVDIDKDDARLEAHIASATKEIETFCGRRLVTQTWDYTLEKFEDPYTGSRTVIELPNPPLVSVVSIKYTDTAGSEVTLATTEYTEDTDGVYGRVLLAKDKSWPDLLGAPNAREVTIQHISGFGAAAKVPSDLKDAAVLIVQRYYDGPTPEGEVAISRILWHHRVLRVA